MDISLIYVDPNTNVVSLKLSSKLLTGLPKLIQIVVLSLLTVPGRDILYPEAGGGIPEMISMNLDPSDYSEVLAELTRRIKKTEREVLENQVGSTSPLAERLRELKIISVGPGASVDEIYARIRIINELGQQSDVVI
jgi:phage baseplate assembly protein W